MKSAACTAAAVIAIILAGAVAAKSPLRDYRGDSSYLPRVLAEQPYEDPGSDSDRIIYRYPRYVLDFGTDIERALPQQLNNEDTSYMDNAMRAASAKRSAVATALNAGRRRRQPTPALGKAATPYVGVGAVAAESQLRDYRGHSSYRGPRLLAEQPYEDPDSDSDRIIYRYPRYVLDFGTDIERALPQQLNNEDTSYMDNAMRAASAKRSAVATALNAGRRRRQPTPALGKAATPYVGVGVLNDVGSFFDYLRDNLQGLASLTPEQRSTFFQDAPSVVHAPSTGGGGSGTGIRKLHAFHPLRPTGNIRSYNRRSYGAADGGYPRANNHDPGLLWTGLGR